MVLFQSETWNYADLLCNSTLPMFFGVNLKCVSFIHATLLLSLAFYSFQISPFKRFHEYKVGNTLNQSELSIFINRNLNRKFNQSLVKKPSHAPSCQPTKLKYFPLLFFQAMLQS